MKAYTDDVIIKKTEVLQIIMGDLALLAGEIGNDNMMDTVKELANRVETPFTFVIVGEVKAGKSSFINALLQTDKEICKVAPSPMTDTIQQILYGPVEKTEIVNPYLKKIYHNIEILKEIAIVDTPGTNTIVEHHQEITERFIPYSDLIVFVFEAKNPYRQSSWEFFDFIHAEWRRKVIFVLQQKDLLPEEDLSVNIQGVRKHAIEKGIENPLIFPVSAKQELEKEIQLSGFDLLRKYLQENITGGRAAFLKLENNINTLLTITNKLDNSIDIRKKQFVADKAFREEIREIMNQHESKTKYQIELLTENLISTYNIITDEKRNDLNEGLSLGSVIKRTFNSLFGSSGNLKEWLTHQSKDFESKLNSRLKERLQGGIIDVAENIQTMGKMVDNKLKYSETILKNSDEIFADIAEKRLHVLLDLQQNVGQFMNTAENFYDEKIMRDTNKIAPNLAAGSGIAIVGVVLAAAVNGAVFDITGGVLTAVGVLFAGITLGINKSKIIRKFDEEIERGKERIVVEIKEGLSLYTERIKNKIDLNFIDFDQLLVKEENTLIHFEEMQNKIRKNLQEL
ncbi:MAG: dynamin family protein [Saprospiraceae bacterium]|nr:dynamin family protein [Saprospiraceae bacterium]MBK7525279.1 dynamin family protein [Saprospiraceae bacterium]MBK8370298.1 dynamin family protein [Saprospiraceae bacterium]MBK8546690.1 dynamin family protein [Saprospiraceae bacterium]MBK8817813.1 dynamin family protein [Saprospiraceae bacterium]